MTGVKGWLAAGEAGPRCQSQNVNANANVLCPLFLEPHRNGRKKGWLHFSLLPSPFTLEAQLLNFSSLTANSPLFRGSSRRSFVDLITPAVAPPPSQKQDVCPSCWPNYFAPLFELFQTTSFFHKDLFTLHSIPVTNLKNLNKTLLIHIAHHVSSVSCSLLRPPSSILQRRCRITPWPAVLQLLDSSFEDY